MRRPVIYRKPRLSSPYLVAGFNGWPNAAGVATISVGYLKDKLSAQKFGQIKPEDSHGFLWKRPATTIKDGVIEELTLPGLPSDDFFYWKNQQASHDLIILLGVEPDTKWERYIDSILDLAGQFGVERIYTIGGLYDSRIPHTREPIISAVVSDRELGEEMRRYGIELTSYQGPSSVHTALVAASKKRNIKAVTLWGHAPHYVQANPKVSYCLLRKLTRMMGIELDLEELRGVSENLEEQVDKVVSQDPELDRYVRTLEAAYQEPAIEGKLVEEVEDFLKKRRGR